MLAEMRTVLLDVQRRRQEIAQKEDAARKFALENNVRSLAETGGQDEQPADPEAISAAWEQSRQRYQEQRVPHLLWGRTRSLQNCIRISREVHIEETQPKHVGF